MTKDKTIRPLSRRRRVLKFIGKIFLSIFIILLVFVVAGALYTWFMGKQQPPQQAVISQEETPAPTIKAPVVAPDAIVSVSAQSVTTPVKPGDNASIVVKTNPEATCTITVTYGEVGEEEKQSDDSGLIKKVSDEFGIVSWAWTVEADRPQGTWPIEVTCANIKNSAYLKSDLVIKRR